jgi:hypothetical protein
LILYLSLEPTVKRINGFFSTCIWLFEDSSYPV